MIKDISSILFFDNECGLCDATILFFLKNSNFNSFKFCSFQSNFSKKFFKDRNIDISKMKTAYFFHKGKLLSKSCAILVCTSLCRGYLKNIYYLIYIPKFIRDLIYIFVAKFRNKLPFKRTNFKLLSKQELKRIIC